MGKYSMGEVVARLGVALALTAGPLVFASPPATAIDVPSASPTVVEQVVGAEVVDEGDVHLTLDKVVDNSHNGGRTNDEWQLEALHVTNPEDIFCEFFGGVAVQRQIVTECIDPCAGQQSPLQEIGGCAVQCLGFAAAATPAACLADQSTPGAEGVVAAAEVCACGVVPLASIELGDTALEGTDPDPAIFEDEYFYDETLPGFVGDIEVARAVGLTGPISAQPGGAEVLFPALYLIRETQLPGYHIAPGDSWYCYNNDMLRFPTDDPTAALLVVYPGGDTHCDIYNSDLPADLSVTKTATPTTVVAGSATLVDFAITVTNELGFVNDGQPVPVSDYLPEGFTWDAASLPEFCDDLGSNLSCDIDPAELGIGESYTFHVKATANADTPSGTYTNVAIIDTYEDDPLCLPFIQEGEGVRGAAATLLDQGCEEILVPCPSDEIFDFSLSAPAARAQWESELEWYFFQSDPFNNIGCADITVTRTAQVTLTKTANAAAPHPGDTYDYTLQVGNAGPSTLLADADETEPVTLTDDLPAGLQLVSVTGGAGWACNNADPVLCTFGDEVSPGEVIPPVTVRVTVKTDYLADSITNTATVTAQFDAIFTQPALGASVAAISAPEFTTSTTATNTVTVVHTSNMSLTKTASTSAVAAGDTFVWTLTATNLGPDTAQNVVVVDNVPAPLQVLSVSSDTFTCAVAANVVTCSKATVALNESGVIRITTLVPAGTIVQGLTNLASVVLVGTDPVPANNIGEQAVMIGSQAPVPPTAPPTVPTQPDGGVLPATGNDSNDIAVLALVALGLGVVARTAARRRRAPLR